ncbi:mechanosensitive ion channel family protein [Tenacibaculum maritimum]|uniref:mechanosensitive ion channel family protein n=1 Tax=Tenacibaculum maritimum TaxID=107401 RepID=UPI001E61497C|nr:mechanosensitive ion channel family protein [Tenacibaculum maritimum]MCD9563176.1 mechanosensitive ion channel family protein [Tenacibaculum maritimum]MCD9566453.1 mechanosensitive ion channel family protein [Tenacibaculum maritimum]MCD9579814.1 mechanosensitive ion channel family protein [Tenacibaculum maritimum]MCD9597228.1 mechanosensitive ion channel family protein [Tenacibaculum maritimum]MCD9614344.1 mechanosensitive ion channel family protein [Tenacibaculum maritimum]
MEKYFGSSYILIKKWGEDIVAYLPKVFLALIVFLAFYYLAKAVKTYSLKFYSKIFTRSKDIAQFISLGIYMLLMLSGIFLALEILELEGLLTKLLAGAGIVGIVAGFAFKDIASNAFAGFLVNMQKPFKQGDWVNLNDNFGVIKEIGWITTSIKTVSGQEVFVPNQLIYNNSFINYSTFKKRRIILQSGVSYGDDLELVKKVTLNEIHQIDRLLKNEEIDFYFTSIGGSAYNFEVRFWIRFHKNTDYLNAMSEAIMRIKKRFEEEQISIAYPVQTLDFGVKGGVNIFDNPIELKK